MARDKYPATPRICATCTPGAGRGGRGRATRAYRLRGYRRRRHGPHGRIADEIEALKGIGMSRDRRAGRGVLGCPSLAGPAGAGPRRFGRSGRATADDPRRAPAVLNRPDLVILRGQTF